MQLRKLSFLAALLVLLLSSCSEEQGLTLIDELILENDTLTDFPTNDFHERYELPDSLRASEIDDMLDRYGLAEEAEREELRAEIDSLTSIRLLSYAYFSSVEGVRTDSEIMLRNGLISLSLENANIGFVDHLTAFSLLWHSHLKLGLDPQPVFEQVADFSSPEYARKINDFLARSDAQKEIRTFGYVDINSPNFDYVFRSYRIDQTNQASGDSIKGEILPEQ